MPISKARLDKMIAATEASITVYEAATLALGSGTIQTYTLDTGQNRQTVTKLEIRSLEKTIDQLYNRLSVLCARRDGSGITRVEPGW